jgi:hypothetical protein
LLGGIYTWGYAWAALVGATVAWASCSDDTVAEQICDPGSNVFCRCRGTREAGTKTCNEAGDGFGECENGFGVCEEIEDPGTGGSGNDPGVGGHEPPPPPPPGELYAACHPEDGPACNEGLECANGYCTKACESFEDCTAAGDCIAFGANQRCAPYCVEQIDCENYDGSVSCGFTPDAVPPYDVVVCAQWADELALPPDGYPPGGNCSDDVICNLGFEGTERVCDTFLGCTDGCHIDADCASSEGMCSSSGPDDVGSCDGQGGNIDACPGITVTMSLSQSSMMLMGDTGLAPPPSEAIGEGNCNFAAETEEDIYHVVIEDSGNLIILLEPDATYDSILYVREASCDVGAQVACEDEIGSGVGEITELPVLAGDELWVFVDGFYSTGTYTLSLDLE